MNANHSLHILTLALVLGACAPVSGYTEAEAPKTVTLDSAVSHFDVRFAPGGAAIASADAAQLRQLAASGTIAPADRVMVAAAGPPELATQRLASVSALLLHYGVVTVPDRLAHVPPERGVVQVTRTLVTLPPCPNWSKASNYDFGNQPSSNFGCATQSNLAKMVANPTDLASGLPNSAASGQPAAAAVNRYMIDKVTPLPVSGTASAFSSSQGSTPGANAPTGSP
jgi:pilus assembly protein CpaD